MKEAATHIPVACPQWAEALNAVHRDDLPFEQRLALRQHLETCANCRAIKAEYRAMDALITGLPDVEPLASMPARLQEFLGVYEEDELLHGQDDLAAKLASSSANNRTSTRSRSPHRRSKIITKKLNLVAAVLMIVAILGGFLVLSAVRHSNEANANQEAIYTFSSELKNGTAEFLISALNPRDHSLLWQSTLGPTLVSPVLITGGHVYYLDTRGTAYALSTSGGIALWHTRLILNKDVGQISSPVQFSGPPLAHGDLMFVSTTSGDLYALKASTGAIAWSRHFQGCTPDDKWGTPGVTGQAPYSDGVGCQVLLDTQANGILYGSISRGDAFSVDTGQRLGVTASEVDAWNEANGQTLWSKPDSPFAILGVAHNKLYARTRTNDGIDVLNARDGSFLHTLKGSSSSSVLQVATNANVLYTTDLNNMLSAYSLSNDTLLWRKKLTLPNEQISVTASTVYVFYGDGPGTGKPGAKGPPTELYALNANTGSQLWHWQAPESGANALVEVNGVVCLDTTNGIYAFQASNGHLLWKLPASWISELTADTAS